MHAAWIALLLALPARPSAPRRRRAGAQQAAARAPASAVTGLLRLSVSHKENVSFPTQIRQGDEVKAATPHELAGMLSNLQWRPVT